MRQQLICVKSFSYSPRRSHYLNSDILSILSFGLSSVLTHISNLLHQYPPAWLRRDHWTSPTAVPDSTIIRSCRSQLLASHCTPLCHHIQGRGGQKHRRDPEKPVHIPIFPACQSASSGPAPPSTLRIPHHSASRENQPNASAV